MSIYHQHQHHSHPPPRDIARLRACGSLSAPIDLTDDADEADAPPPRQHAFHQRHSRVPGESKVQVRASRKRKSAAVTGDGDDNDCASADMTPSSKKTKRAAATDTEKRLRLYRKRAPQAYAEIRHRALTQRMFVIDRQRTPAPADIDPQSPENHATEVVSLAGTTGNIYQITISRVPSCTCPYARKGHQCKHIVYVLARVLRAREDLEYQLAFVSSELRDIFEHAPPLPSEAAAQDGAYGAEMDGNRKPLAGEDCPICMTEFETDNAGKPKQGEDVVYCKAACGNNIHKECFGQWAATKWSQAYVTCPFCRSPWQEDADATAADLKGVAMGGSRNREGYVNIARQLGLSGRRDYSTFNEYWVRVQRGGEGFGDY